MTCVEDYPDELLVKPANEVIPDINEKLKEEDKKVAISKISDTTLESIKELTPRFEISAPKSLKDSRQCKYSSIKEKLDPQHYAIERFKQKEYLIDFYSVLK